MSQVVGGELSFAPFGIAEQRRRHDAGAEDQQVQRSAAGKEAPGEGTDRGGVGQLHLGHLDLGEPGQQPARGDFDCMNSDVIPNQPSFITGLLPCGALWIDIQTRLG